MYSINHNMHDELQLFISRWGIDAQEVMAIEEMSELIKELCKKHRGRDNSADIVEETADVLITVLQMAEINGYDDVMAVVDFKMRRALNKIESNL